MRADVAAFVSLILSAPVLWIAAGVLLALVSLALAGVVGLAARFRPRGNRAGQNGLAAWKGLAEFSAALPGGNTEIEEFCTEFAHRLRKAAGFERVIVLLSGGGGGASPPSRALLGEYARRSWAKALRELPASRGPVSREAWIDSFGCGGERGEMLALLGGAEVDWVLPIADGGEVLGWVLVADAGIWLSVGSLGLAGLERVVREFALTLRVMRNGAARSVV